jgi:hypothetical protein
MSNNKDFTANAEAHEIINSFYFQLPNNGSRNIGLMNCSQRMEEAEKCAIILVEKILKVLESERVFERLEYYQEVKKEILCIISQMK